MKLEVQRTEKDVYIPPRAMTIAGSDSGGGAGIQADLKTFTAFQVYSTSVIAALTAQNTTKVSGIHAVPSEFVEEQLVDILEDIGTDSVKTGMLFNTDIIKTVVKVLKKYNVTKVVVDPVMIASSGAKLLQDDTIEVVRNELLPIAYVITPNIPEAEVLTGLTIKSIDDMKAAAKKLYDMGVKYPLVKGGHIAFKSDNEVAKNGEEAAYITDVLYDGKDFFEEKMEYVHTQNTHGTGCTLSSAIAAGLAKNESVLTAYRNARNYLQNALKYSFNIGKGHGPLNHYHNSVLFPDNRTFVQTLKDYAKKEYDDYVNHEFVKRIADGTLPVESFKHFLCQDYIYLTHYARVHAVCGFKLNNLREIAEEADIISIIRTETQLHIKYCESWGISLEELERTKEASANMAYTRFCIEKGLSGDILDLKVALFACLIGYGEIGVRIVNDPNTKRENNPYYKWAENYAADLYQKSVTTGIAEIEKLAKEYIRPGDTKRIKELCEIFRQASRLEANFFEMGLRQI
jgi:thiaminase II